jgi:hypothetical protein
LKQLWGCKIDIAAVTSLRQIQLEIAMEEFVCTSEGVEIEREHTPSTFIVMGLHIEESQCVFFLFSMP